MEIADDGRGLNTDKIKEKAIAKGLASAAEIEKMSEAQIHRFIFAAGFSTAAKVTNVSGRGVGMDVVLSNIDQIGGSVDVKSIPGEGSIFTIKIPLTLAIISALIIEAGGERFAIPQLAVIELVRVKNNTEHRIEHIKDTPVLRLRNKLLPLIHLGRLLELDSKDDPGSRDRLHRGDPDRQPHVRHRGRRRVPHRGNRREADGDQAAAHLGLLRQHHPRRRFGDHDPRSERRRRSGRRLHAIGDARHGTCRGSRPRREQDLAAGLPRRLLRFQGGAARARHAARGSRGQEDRIVERPPSSAISRPAHAAHPRQRQRQDQG